MINEMLNFEITKNSAYKYGSSAEKIIKCRDDQLRKELKKDV